MTPSDPPRLDAVLLDLPVRTKTEVLTTLATRVAAFGGLEPLAVARALVDREKLGSTGVGSGVALPHCAVEGLVAPIALFARLARPIDWEAIDDDPVDLILAVVAPARATSAALNTLSKFARLLRSEDTRTRLRSADAPDVARALATPNGDCAPIAPASDTDG